MDFPSQLVLVRFLKFASVFTYVASVGGSLATAEVSTRKRMVHLLASPALVAVWLSGYVLTLLQRIPLGEAWIIGGFVCSLASQLLLTRTTREPAVASRSRAAVLLTLGGTLYFMVFRPTWWSLQP